MLTNEATVTLTVKYPTDFVSSDLKRWIVSAVQSNIDNIVVSVDNWEVKPHVCPGLDCPDAWHTGGCGPMWDYADADGYLIDPGVNAYAEQDAVERRRWDGPDEPALIQVKRDGEWCDT